MIPLLLQIFRQVFRTRIFYAYLAIALTIHWLALQGVLRLRTHVSGELNVGPILSESHTFFTSIFIQLFCGAFLAGIFGIWVVPYLHQGPRSRLTFTLPLHRWKFPLVYALTLLIILLFLDVGVFFVMSSFAGTIPQISVAPPLVPVTALPSSLFICLILQLVAFEVLMFGFALGSLTIGQMPTFLLGTLTIGVLQGMGIFFHLTNLGWGEPAFRGGVWFRIYSLLPPVGELAFDLWKQYKKPDWGSPHLSLWLVWLIVLAVLFCVRISKPSSLRS